MILHNTEQLHIGFYGHSSASWAGNPKSLIDQVINYFDAALVNRGVPQGSEERILFDLKKTKHIDIAVIFHSGTSRYMFLPKCKRDISAGAIPEDKAEVLWLEDDSIKNVTQEQFEKHFSYGKIPEVFGDMETFINCMKLYKKFLHHHDLARNRYEGARCLIDSYCLNKVPKVIHIIDANQEPIGTWFKFQSGIVSYDIGKMVENYSSTEKGHFPNNISEEGNKIIAQEIIKIIKDNNWDKIK